MPRGGSRQTERVHGRAGVTLPGRSTSDRGALYIVLSAQRIKPAAWGGGTPWPTPRRSAGSATSSSRGPRERPWCGGTPCASCATPRRTTPRGWPRSGRRGAPSTSRTTSFTTTTWGSASPPRSWRRRATGVPVRVVYDWFGSLGKASAGFWRRLREGGVDVRCYNPPRLDQPLGWIGRDHRKCLVVDGQVAFVTGLCVGRMWEGAPERGLAGVARHRCRGSRPRGGRGGPRLRRHLGGHGRAPASRRGRRRGAPRGGRPGPARRGVDAGHRRALPPRSPGGLAGPPHAVAHRRLLRGHVQPTCRRCGRRRRTAST